MAFWTHLLAVVYILPAVAYLILRRRWRWSAPEVGVTVAGALVGVLPLIVHNAVTGFPTLLALLQPADLPLDPAAQFFRFFRVGVPVLAGLGQPTTSEVLFDQDWLNRPAGQAWIAGLLLLVLVAALASYLPALVALIRGGAERHTVEPALLLLLVLAVPPLIAVTRFGFFVSEPRYALPLYSAVPLLAGALWRFVGAPWLRAAIVVTVLGANVWSLLSTDVRLWRSEEAPHNTAASRAELVRHLVADNRHQLYTDYWIGYPIMFETGETVLAYIVSGGFNRYVPPADNVQRTPNPAWVFTPGSEAERAVSGAVAQRRRPGARSPTLAATGCTRTSSR